jgi:hypothetical protein
MGDVLATTPSGAILRTTKVVLRTYLPSCKQLQLARRCTYSSLEVPTTVARGHYGTQPNRTAPRDNVWHAALLLVLTMYYYYRTYYYY